MTSEARARYDRSSRYGYAFAAAEIGLQHSIVDGLMIYAGHAPSIALPPPAILHYGLWCQVQAPSLPHSSHLQLRVL